MKITSPTEHIVKIGGCPRCGKDHDQILIQQMANPTEGFRWFGWCPETNSPILIEDYSAPGAGMGPGPVELADEGNPATP